MTLMNTPSDMTGRSAPQDSAISRFYRDVARETPPTAIDERIHASARDAVVDSSRRHRMRRWVLPVSIAAMVVLSLGVLLQVSRYELLPKQNAALPHGTAAPSTESPTPQRRARSDRSGAIGSVDGLHKDNSDASRLKMQEAAPQKESRRAASDFAASSRRESERQLGAAEEKTALTAAALAQAKQSGANVVAVKVSGAPGGYYFSVTIRSPDTGCKQYADWWEVVGEDGRLLYRRVLFHSHAQEQPFERSGGPVPIQSDTVVWVRAHMNTVGYGGVTFKGSVNTGFKSASPVKGFAATLEKQRPLPDGCAF